MCSSCIQQHMDYICLLKMSKRKQRELLNSFLFSWHKTQLDWCILMYSISVTMSRCTYFTIHQLNCPIFSLSFLLYKICNKNINSSNLITSGHPCFISLIKWFWFTIIHNKRLAVTIWIDMRNVPWLVILKQILTVWRIKVKTLELIRHGLRNLAVRITS